MSELRICRVEAGTYVAAETIRLAYEEGQRGKPEGKAFGLRIDGKLDLWMTPEHTVAIMEEVERRTGSLDPDFVPVSAEELESIRRWAGIATEAP